MFSVDAYLSRMPAPDYNCLDFACEVAEELFGVDTARRLGEISLEVRSDDIRISTAAVRDFRRLEEPSDPCLVVMRRSRSELHIGVYIRGRVLHLKESGVEYQPLRVIRRFFTRIGFYL